MDERNHGKFFMKYHGNSIYYCMGKTCTKCKVEKELSDFWKDRRTLDGYNTICAECQRKYQKVHYTKRKDSYLNRGTKWRNKQKQLFINFLTGKKCVDCGEDDIIVLEFDHKGDKSFEISRKIGALKLETLMKEIDKCDIVCANCHKRRTAKQFGWVKLGLCSSMVEPLLGKEEKRVRLTS